MQNELEDINMLNLSSKRAMCVCVYALLLLAVVRFEKCVLFPKKAIFNMDALF